MELRKPKSGSFLSNFLVLLSGNAIAQVIPLLCAPIIARIFTPEDFAIQGNFTALVGIIAIIGAGRYELAFVLPKSEEKANTLLLIAIRIALIISVLSLVLIFFRNDIAKLYNSKEFAHFIPIIAIGVFVVTFYSIFNQWLTRLKEFKSLSKSKIVQALALNLTTILFGYLKFGASGLIWGWMIGFALSLVFLLPKFIKKIGLKLASKPDIIPTMKEYKDFPIVNSLHAFTDLFFTQLVLFTFITREYGLIIFGLFFMMNKYMRAPMRLIGNSIGQVFYQEANSKFLNRENVTNVLLKTLKISLVFGIPFLLIILFFGKTLFIWYLGKKWAMTGVYAQIMAIPMFLNLLSSPISSAPLIYDKQKSAYTISLTAYILSIGAIYYGVIQHWAFTDTLKIFSIVMSIYYLVLICWYFLLSKNKK